MPRVGLDTAQVVAAGAALADERGIDAVSFAALADALGVRAPSLYKHVDSVTDLRRRIATLAMAELADELREALQGTSGQDALAALFTTLRAYIRDHPGRYRATVGARFDGGDDPLRHAATRVIGSLRAVISGYGLADADLDHAIRTLRCLIHGYALLDADEAFQWDNDPDASFAWMLRFADAGLRTLDDGARHR